MLTIIDALRDPDLLGHRPAFKELATWTRWIVFLKSVYGLDLTSEETAIFKHHTKRSHYAPPPGGWDEAAAVVGMQAGKSRVATAIVSYERLVAEPEPDGTDLYAVLVARGRSCGGGLGPHPVGSGAIPRRYPDRALAPARQSRIK